MATHQFPEFNALLDEFSNSMFWLARQMENLVDALGEIEDDPYFEYERRGYPLGKSVRGYKKWVKRYYKDVLDSIYLEHKDVLDAKYLNGSDQKTS